MIKCIDVGGEWGLPAPPDAYWEPGGKTWIVLMSDGQWAAVPSWLVAPIVDVLARLEPEGESEAGDD